MIDTPRRMGVPDRIAIPAPVAGANWSFTNDHGELIIVRSASFVFTTSAVVANRVVGLTLSNGEVIWLRTSTGLAQAASLVIGYCAFGSGSSAAISPAGVSIPWRDDGVLIRQGHVLASVTAAIDPGDTYTAIILDVVRLSPDYPYGGAPYRVGYSAEVEPT